MSSARIFNAAKRNREKLTIHNHHVYLRNKETGEYIHQKGHGRTKDPRYAWNGTREQLRKLMKQNGDGFYKGFAMIRYSQIKSIREDVMEEINV